MMRPGDMIVLKDEVEILEGDPEFILEWDHCVLFPTRDSARNMLDVDEAFYIEPGILGTIISCDPHFVKIIVSDGVGWSRSCYWKVIK